MVLTNPNPRGIIAFPASSVVAKPLHLRIYKSRHGVIVALGRDAYRMDSAMGIVITSRLTKSCLSSSIKSSDFVLKTVESKKFAKVRWSYIPISSSFTWHFIPLALNYMGLREICYHHGN